jgi:hypothetical protein
MSRRLDCPMQIAAMAKSDNPYAVFAPAAEQRYCKTGISKS